MLKTKSASFAGISKNKFFNYTTVIYVVLIIAATVMASKIWAIHFGNDFYVILDAGVITYPFTFLIGDILAEIYGFKEARKVILWGFAANLFFSLICFMGVLLPSYDDGASLTLGYNALFAYNLRILAASFAAYIAGALLNAASLIWIKRLTRGKLLAVRTIGSTALGAFVDSGMFTVLAFAGILGGAELAVMGLTSFIVKMLFEVIVATPVDYALIPLLKKIVKEPQKEAKPAAERKDAALSEFGENQ
ncbi:MAG: queuosine precursor transporter [Clostridiales bacterium]|jgi:uncharacterized integral membrane protein (TIGR00697 family)|nr:queuosine precursor transporter [Clostridiales bacterium]